MAFARQFYRAPSIDLSRFIDTPRQRKDPCFNCTLPICDPSLKQCAFVNTSFQVVGSSRYSRKIERERQELLDELKEQGVITVRPSGFIEYAGDETDADRKRRQNREHMRRKRNAKTISIAT